MAKISRFFMTICMILSVLPANLVMAADNTPEIQAGLMEFANHLGELDSFEEMGLPIPLTGQTPGEIMGMDLFFQEVFSHIGNNLSVLPELPFDLLDGTTIVALSVDATSEGGFTDVTVFLQATKTVTLPVSYSNNPEEIPNSTESGTCLDFIDNDGDGLTDGEEPDCAPITIEGSHVLEDVVFELETTFQFQYDSSNPEISENFYLISEPTIVLTYSFEGEVNSFPARFGISDIEVAGSASYNTQLDTRILDENLDGKISLWDIDNSIPADFVEMGYVNMPGQDVDVNLSIHSPLLDGTEDGSLELIIPDLSVKPLPTENLSIPTGGGLESFKTIGPDELLTGLASYAYALDTAWIVNEGEIPYIAEKYHQFFTPGANLITLVRRQGDALVLCGTEESIPPSGTPDPIGTQTIYCQAITAEEPANVVEWRLEGGATPMYDGGLDNTVSMNPTAWAVFENVSGNDWKDIEVEFQYTIEGEMESHIAEPRIRTIYDLAGKLNELADVSVSQVTFDSATRALVLDILQEVDPEPDTILDSEHPENCKGCIHLAFGDLLLEQTGLSNVADNTTTTSKVMDLGAITVQAGFGTTLEAGLEDRYFIATGIGNEMFISSLDVSIPGTTTLPGFIGALGVDVKMESFTLTGGVPLAIDIDPSGDGTISTRALINDPVNLVTAVNNLGVDATLKVTSNGLTPNVTGTINIWPDSGDITLDAGAERLKAFNIDSDNSQALINLILDGIYNRTSQMYNETKAGEPLPILGQSTRQLAPQFMDVINAVNVIKTGGTEADVYCEVVEKEVENEEGMQIQVECWAISDSTPSTVNWVITPSAITIPSENENLDDPATIWADPEADGAKAIFVISGDATPTQLNQMSVTLTIDGSEIQFPYTPPQTVEELKLALERQLLVTPENNDAVEFMLGTDNELRIKLVKNDAENKNFLIQLDVQDSYDNIYRISAQKSGGQANELPATVASGFTLDFNIPLETGVAMQDLSFNTASSVKVAVDINQSDFDIIAALGGLTLGMGNNTVTSADSRPELELTVETNPASYSAINDEITLTYTITNIGDFTLSGPITVNAGILSTSCGGESTQLASTDDPETEAIENEFTCDFVYIIDTVDASSPAVRGTASATAWFGSVQLISPNVQISIPNTNGAEISLSSRVAPLYYSNAGDVLDFTYTIENIGQVDLSTISVTDELIDSTLINCGDDGNPIASLAVGAEATCTAEYTIPVGDLPSSVISEATASTLYNSNTISALVILEVTTTPKPPIELTVEVNPGTVMVGETLYYEYKVKNIGAETLNAITVSVSLPEVAVTCPVDSLASGSSMICTAEYLVTQADLDSGVVVSIAHVEGSAGSESYESDSVTSSLEVTNVTAQSGLIVGYRSTLQFNSTDGGTDWERTLEGTLLGEDNDDIKINLAVRTIQDLDEKSIGLLNYQYEITDGEATIPPIAIPAEMEGELNVAPLDPSLISLSLPLLGTLLKDSLDGDRWGIRLPLAGSNLAAGEDFEALLNGWAEDLDVELESLDTSTPKGLHDNLQDAMESVFGNIPVDVVNVYCVGDELCDDSSDEKLVIRVEIDLPMIMPNEPSTRKIPFDTGLPGLALEVLNNEGTVSSTTTWNLDLAFGIDQFYGPYVVVNDADDLYLNTALEIDEDSTCPVPSIYGKITENLNPSGRCMDGMIGLLPGKLYDGDGDNRSSITFTTIYNLGDGGNTPGMLTYAELWDGQGANLEPDVSVVAGSAQINLLFVTNSSPIPMPQIAGTIHIGLDYPGELNKDVYEYDELEYSVSYENIYMNATTFFGDFLGPLVEDVQAYTKPLQPVIDTVTAPIPVISDLSGMIGGGSISLLTVLQGVSGNDLKLLTTLANLITFINGIPADRSGLWIGLGPGEEDEDDSEEYEVIGDSGAFSIDPETVIKLACAIDDKFSGDCESETERKASKINDDNDKKIKENIDKVLENIGSAERSWDGAGISLPFLTDSEEIYGMLLGEDATLLRVDLGTLSASAGLEYTYGPFFIGPVPVTLTIGGTVTFEGRFAIGYDTRGLRQALRGNAFSGKELLQGIYIDDLDIDGNDVPEIKLEVEIYGGAAVSIRIFEAGIRAGVIFGVELNWNDPNRDGKLRFEEISMWSWKPICLFDRRGYIGFYLKFYLKIDLFLFSKTWDWNLLSKTYDLFNESCTPPNPVFAQNGGNNRFRLNMGNYDDARHLPSDDNEKFIVRQLTPKEGGCQKSPADACDDNGTWISVTFLGIYREYWVPEGYHIYAEAGDGNDVISMLSGTDQREAYLGDEVPFTLDAELYGGAGDDDMDTGAGNDYINGGPGSDTLNARSGDDILIAGIDDAVDANNSLDGGLGMDILYGGPGSDALTGGPGKDLLAGNAGNDRLAGGPGMPPNSAVEDAVKDFTDVLVGGGGDDILEGSFGADYLLGDGFSSLPVVDDLSMGTNRGVVVLAAISGAAALTCESSFDGSGDDSLIGGDGDDFLYGGDGNDRLEGEKGNDTLCGNAGNDILTGAKGDDWLYGNAGHDWLQGDQGIDHLYGGADDDDLLGGEGSDVLYGDGGNDILIGDMGSIVDHPEDVTCLEWDEDVCIDEITTPADHPTDTSQAPEFVIPITESPTTTDLSFADEMYGSAGNDFMFGEFGIDHMYGEGDSDYMEGNAGNDIMEGGAGPDYMLGGQDADNMQGGTENDHMWGNSGNDKMYGNDGTDEMHGNTGNDYMEGNAGKDTMYGDADPDDIIGGSSIAESEDKNECADDDKPCGDSLYGNEGDDRIAGDNAQMTEAGVILLDIETQPGEIDDDWYGDDTIEGNDGNDQIWGQGGVDTIYGGDGDDYIEGNHGSDDLYGDAGDDDILGGSSPVYTGIAGPPYTDQNAMTYTDQSDRSRLVPLGETLSVEVPLGDTIHGGNGSDVILGDNGIITRPDGNIRQSYQLELDTIGNEERPHSAGGGTGTRVMRTVEMVNTEAGFVAGSDLIYGEAGDDELYGQFDDTFSTAPAIGDELYGGEGQDLLIGDQGVAVSSVMTGETRTIKSNPPFLNDLVFLKGTLHWDVDLAQSVMDGNDRLSGGDGADYMHGGGGYDLMNGNAGNDRLFGDDGDDAMWGGQNHDHLYGGNGDDALDVLPRDAQEAKGNREGYPADPLTWTEWTSGEKGSWEDFDILYGGWGQDAMQADQYEKGNAPGDRLIDWVGVYNIYYLCGKQYGEFVITRSPSPSVIDFLVQLAASDGAPDAGLAGSSGFEELALVLKGDFSRNSHPIHVDTPGHATCPQE